MEIQLNQSEQEEIFIENVLDKQIENQHGEKKKISEVIDMEKHIWNTNGKIIFKHEAIQRLANFVGAEMLEPKLLVEPSTMNGQTFVFLCKFKFPNGEISTEIGESNQFNTTSISRMYPASVAFKRGYDRAFLRSQFMNLFDAFSDIESDDFVKVDKISSEDVLDGYAEMFNVKKESNSSVTQSQTNVDSNNVNHQKNIQTPSTPVSNQTNNQSVESDDPSTDIDSLINELQQNNNKEEQVEQKKLSENEIMDKMRTDDTLLRLPKTDEKYPEAHIVKDIIKKHNDFDYLNTIKELYPKNIYYQNMIQKLQSATAGK